MSEKGQIQGFVLEQVRENMKTLHLNRLQECRKWCTDDSQIISLYSNCMQRQLLESSYASRVSA